jgi:hypothetical protein
MAHNETPQQVGQRLLVDQIDHIRLHFLGRSHVVDLLWIFLHLDPLRVLSLLLQLDRHILAATRLTTTAYQTAYVPGPSSFEISQV